MTRHHVVSSDSNSAQRSKSGTVDAGKCDVHPTHVMLLGREESTHCTTLRHRKDWFRFVLKFVPSLAAQSSLMALYVHHLVTMELHEEDIVSDNQVYLYFGAALLMLPYVYSAMCGSTFDSVDFLTACVSSPLPSTAGSRLLVDLIQFAADPKGLKKTFKLVSLPHCYKPASMNVHDSLDVHKLQKIEGRPHIKPWVWKASWEALWKSVKETKHRSPDGGTADAATSYLPSVSVLRCRLFLELFVNVGFPLFFLLTLPLVLSQSESSLELVMNMTAVCFIAQIDDKMRDNVNCIYVVHRKQFKKEMKCRKKGKVSQPEKQGSGVLGFGDGDNASN